MDFHEKCYKITVKELKFFCNVAFKHLPVIFSCFPVKFNQNQPAFFGTEEVIHWVYHVDSSVNVNEHLLEMTCSCACFTVLFRYR